MTGKAPRQRISWTGTLWALFAAAQAIPALTRQAEVLKFPRLEQPLMPADPDIWIYLTQVRQWIIDGLGLFGRPAGWFFDHMVRHTNGPFGGVPVHWTRPMQLLLALFYFFTPAGPDINVRLMLAANWLPFFLCLVATGLLAASAQRYFRHGCVFALVVLLMLLNPETAKNFAPGNADHHGLLSMLWCGAIYFLLDNSLSAPGAAALGAVLGLMAWTSVEALVLAGLAFGFLGFESLFRPEKTRLLLAATLGAALVATGGILMEMPVENILTHPAYDTLSIVYVTLFWLAAAGASLLTLLLSLHAPAWRRLELRGRFCAAAITGTGILAVLYSLYPKVFGGPLVEADPFIAASFLPRINEMKPLFRIPAEIMVAELVWPCFASFLILRCLAYRKLRSGRRRQLLVLLVLLLGNFTVMLAENRWAYYVQPVAILAVAAVLPALGAQALPHRFRWLPPLPRSWRPWRWIMLAYALLLLITHAYPARLSSLYHAEQTETGFCMAQIRQVVQTRQLQPLLGGRDLVLFLPENLGGDALFFTPYLIIATNLHREGPELNDMRRIEMAETAREAETLLRRRQTEALLYCPTRYGTKSWLRSVAEGGKYPDWLAPVTGLRFLELPGPKPVLLQVKE